MKKLANKGDSAQASQAGGGSKRRAPQASASGSREPAKRAGVAARPSERTEELRFKVTPEVKREFKRAAKEAALKKGDFLARLLATWATAKGPATEAARPKAKR